MDVVTSPVIDRPLDYPGWDESHPGRCRMRAFPDIKLVVVSELEDNPGPSITNCIEHVASAAEEELDARFFGTSWRLVEHDPSHGPNDPLAFTLVTFSGYDRRTRHLVNPGWQPIPGAMDWLRDVIVD